MRAGIPLLDYRGSHRTAVQPIAIAHYGWRDSTAGAVKGDSGDRTAWLAASRWLVTNLQSNAHGVPVWLHHFDWQYRQLLERRGTRGSRRATAYRCSIRAATETGDDAFAEAAHRAFQSLELPVSRGGCS
jgi:hypothetical protein